LVGIKEDWAENSPITPFPKQSYVCRAALISPLFFKVNSGAAFSVLA
jgi:hypothetical protein